MPVSYTHLDVYKRQDKNDLTRVSVNGTNLKQGTDYNLLSDKNGIRVYKTYLSTLKAGTYTAEPVSYTHLRDRSLKLCISGIACVAVAVGLVHGDQIAVIIKGCLLYTSCSSAVR